MTLADQLAESIRFPRESLISQFPSFDVNALIRLFYFLFIFLANLEALVVSAPENGYADLVFGVQWSWTEPEERSEQLQGLSDCVSRRLDQGTVIKA